MSISTVAPQIPAGCYAFTFPALTAGGNSVSSNVEATYLASTVAQFLPGVSRVVGCVRTTAGGTVGQPFFDYSMVANSAASGFLIQFRLASQSLLDTSVYTIYWTQQIGKSDVKTMLPC